MRWGEATGLRVKHVDLKRRRVSVEENAVEVGSFIEIGTPKTHEKRQVPYPAFLADTIQRLVAGKSRDAIVFGEGTIHVRRPKAATGWFNSAVCRAQEKSAAAIEAAVDAGEEPPRPFPRVTPHELRHTAASLAISAGANVKAVQRMLGHASAAMTLDIYTDLFDDDLDAVSAALDDAAGASGIIDLLRVARLRTAMARESGALAVEGSHDTRNVMRGSCPCRRLVPKWSAAGIGTARFRN